MRSAFWVSLGDGEDKEHEDYVSDCVIRVPGRKNPCCRGSRLWRRILRSGSLRVIDRRRERRGPRPLSARGGKMLVGRKW